MNTKHNKKYRLCIKTTYIKGWTVAHSNKSYYYEQGTESKAYQAQRGDACSVPKPLRPAMGREISRQWIQTAGEGF